MAGGDYALIRSVEGFEDHPRFGRYQIEEAGVADGDVVVAITEGGETPFVIGTAWQGLVDYGGCMARMVAQLCEPAAMDALVRLTRFEQQVYEHNGLVTYATADYLLDVLTDTTERAPTFRLPPVSKVRRCGLGAILGVCEESAA